MPDQQQHIVPVMATHPSHQNPPFLPDPAIPHQERPTVLVTATSPLYQNPATQPDPDITPQEYTDPFTATIVFQPDITPLKARVFALSCASRQYAESCDKMVPHLAHRPYTRHIPFPKLEEKGRTEIVLAMTGLYMALWRASALHEDPNFLIRELEDSTRFMMVEPAEAREELKELITGSARNFTIAAERLVDSMGNTLGAWESAFGVKVGHVGGRIGLWAV
jgi:hypothetical protein